MSCLVYICGAGAVGGIELNFKEIEQSILSCYDVGKFHSRIKKSVLNYFIINFIHIHPPKNKKSKKTDKENSKKEAVKNKTKKSKTVTKTKKEVKEND